VPVDIAQLLQRCAGSGILCDVTPRCLCVCRNCALTPEPADAALGCLPWRMTPHTPGVNWQRVKAQKGCRPGPAVLHPHARVVPWRWLPVVSPHITHPNPRTADTALGCLTTLRMHRIQQAPYWVTGRGRQGILHRQTGGRAACCS
jgi:hypothetical protein